jgi:hypothetical protein
MNYLLIASLLVFAPTFATSKPQAECTIVQLSQIGSACNNPAFSAATQALNTTTGCPSLIKAYYDSHGLPTVAPGAQPTPADVKNIEGK